MASGTPHILRPLDERDFELEITPRHERRRTRQVAKVFWQLAHGWPEMSGPLAKQAAPRCTRAR